MILPQLHQTIHHFVSLFEEKSRLIIISRQKPHLKGISTENAWTGIDFSEEIVVKKDELRQELTKLMQNNKFICKVVSKQDENLDKMVQKLQKELKWSKNKQKQQLRQIQKLKHVVSSRQTFIKDLLYQKQQLESIAQQNSDPTFQTPRSNQYKTLDAVPGRICQSIQSQKQVQTSVVLNLTQRKVNHIPSKTNEEEYSPIDKTKIFDKIQKNTVNQPQQMKFFRHTDEMKQKATRGSFYFHSDIDKKDKIIKQLGSKCLFLQSYIEELTKKLFQNNISSHQPQIKTISRTQSKQKEQYERREIEWAVKRYKQ